MKAKTRKHETTKEFRLSSTVRARIRGVKYRDQIFEPWEFVAGYTMGDLMQHIESNLRAGMTWENFGDVWEIDHTRPCASFNYKFFDDPEFRICWGLSNIQVLTYAENRLKKSWWMGYFWIHGVATKYDPAKTGNWYKGKL